MVAPNELNFYSFKKLESKKELLSNLNVAIVDIDERHNKFVPNTEISKRFTAPTTFVQGPGSEYFRDSHLLVDRVYLQNYFFTINNIFLNAN